MNQYKYLLDTVSITQMTKSQLKSKFVQYHCLISEEVLYELRPHASAAYLNELNYEVDVDVLRCIKDIFVDVEIDFKILDLYSNRGNGDIILLAIALNERNKNSEQLFTLTMYKIVTEDKELRSVAEKLRLETLSTEDFVSLIKEA